MQFRTEGSGGSEVRAALNIAGLNTNNQILVKESRKFMAKAEQSQHSKENLLRNSLESLDSRSSPKATKVNLKSIVHNSNKQAISVYNQALPVRNQQAHFIRSTTGIKMRNLRQNMSTKKQHNNSKDQLGTAQSSESFDKVKLNVNLVG